MRSIKPGRGPAKMSFMGSVFASVFGVFWTIMAFAITKDAPFPMVKIIFPLFGVMFVGMGIYQAIYSYKNATGKERYSIVDIVDSTEEGDPASEWVKSSDGYVETPHREDTQQKASAYCPYCGAAVQIDYQFCPKCGKDIKNK